MKILVFGGGAVGLGISSCLAEAGVAPDILARPDTADLLNTEGLFRTGIFGEGHYKKIKAFSALADIFPDRPYDFILVCTKSHDSETVARQLARHPELAGDHTAVVLCQNGWGNREIFLDHFSSAAVYNARVITGFHRPGPNRVNITVHVQPMTLGSMDHAPCPELEPLREAINRGDFPCDITDAIEKDLWAKMLFNCALNPLGAIFDVPYGDLKKTSESRAIIKDIIQEIFAVIRAAGFATHWDDPVAYYDVLMSTLIPDAASHESSTLQDIRAGKKTEINALTGAVVRLAADHDIPVPINTTLYRMIRFMEGADQ